MPTAYDIFVGKAHATALQPNVGCKNLTYATVKTSSICLSMDCRIEFGNDGCIVK